MPDFTQRQQQNGITVERDGSDPLHFPNLPAYADWERRYLFCIVVNGAPSVCFQLHPPQIPVDRKAAHRLRHG